MFVFICCNYIYQLLGMPLVHPDDLETTDGEYYQNFCSVDGDISELGLSFSEFLCCPVCEKYESFDLPSTKSYQHDVNEHNKVRKIYNYVVSYMYINDVVHFRMNLLEQYLLLNWSIQSREKLNHS